MELRKRANATLWCCSRCERMGATIANWSEAGVEMGLLKDVIESSRGVRDLGCGCPICATPMAPVAFADLSLDVCKACRVISAPKGSALIPEGVSGARTTRDLEAQRELSVAVSQLQFTERTPEFGEDPEILDESGLTLDAIPWFTGALIIGAWLGFDHSGQGPEIRAWAFDPESPFRRVGLPLLLYPLLNARIELMLLYTLMLARIGHQLEYRVPRRELAMLAGSTAVASGLFLTLFSVQGALIGLGGVCTAMVTLHSWVTPHPYLTFKNISHHRYGGGLRVFASPLVKAPLFMIYTVYLFVLLIGHIVYTILTPDDPNAPSVLLLTIPHLVGVAMASLWLRRLSEYDLE